MRKTEGVHLKTDPSSSAEGSGNPLVSVIMNCYNGERYLREAIDSVRQQTYGNWELVFWDNASVDRTAEIVHSYADARIRYHRSSQTTPLGSARNSAIAEANGEFIAFLDSDDLWLPAKLELQIRWFQENPECGFCYSNYYKLIRDCKMRKKGLARSQPQGNVFSRFLRQYPVNLQTVMLRTSVLNLFFDPELEVSEEYDLFLRLLYHVRAGYIDTPLVEYRIHGEMSSIRKIEKYATENAIVLQKLLTMIPDLQHQYPTELMHFRAKLGYYEARAEMARHQPDLARAALLPHVRVGVRFLVLYLLALFGRSAWNLVHRAAGRFAK